MISMKTALIAGLGLAPLAFGAAHASSPDEFTLQPVGIGSTVTYTSETYSSGGTTGGTIYTQPTETTTYTTTPTGEVNNDGFQDVNINDYLVPETTQ